MAMRYWFQYTLDDISRMGYKTTSNLLMTHQWSIKRIRERMANDIICLNEIIEMALEIDQLEQFIEALQIRFDEIVESVDLQKLM